MNFPANPLAPASQDQTQSHPAAFHSIVQHTLHAAGKMTVLNLMASKACMKDSVDLMMRVMDVPDMGKAVTMMQAEFLPASEKATSYLRHVTDIGVHAQAAVAETVQARVQDTLEDMGQLVETLAKAAPAGTEPFVESFKDQAAQMLDACERVVRVNHGMVDGYRRQWTSLVEQVAPAATPAKAAKPAKTERAVATAE